MSASRLSLVTDTDPSPARYEISEIWSSNATRQVIRAVDRESQSDVVLIAVPPPRAAGTGARAHQVVMQSLMQRAAAPRGPGLMPAQDVTELQIEGATWMAMSYADTDSEPLAVWLSERENLALPQALRVVRGIALALKTLHAQGLVHGGLDLHTVMMPQEGAPMLCGYGFLDPVLTDLRRAGGATETGPSFLAPEQVRYGRSDVASDIYALGRILGALIGDWNTPPSHIRQVIAMCTAARQQDRYESVAQLLEALGPMPGSMAMADTSEAIRTLPPVADPAPVRPEVSLPPSPVVLPPAAAASAPAVLANPALRPAAEGRHRSMIGPVAGALFAAAFMITGALTWSYLQGRGTDDVAASAMVSPAPSAVEIVAVATPAASTPAPVVEPPPVPVIEATPEPVADAVVEAPAPEPEVVEAPAPKASAPARPSARVAAAPPPTPKRSSIGGEDLLLSR